MHAWLLTLAALSGAADDAKSVRYGIAPDTVVFRQTTPQEALASVLKAAEAKRFDYLAAQLADPAFVDERVHRLYAGRFDEQVEDTRTRLDAPTLDLLRRFLKEGAWQVDKVSAAVTLKAVPGRTVFFRQSGGRWFMEHRNK
jgi:hypothetical protein